MRGSFLLSTKDNRHRDAKKPIVSIIEKEKWNMENLLEVVNKTPIEIALQIDDEGFTTAKNYTHG